MRICIDARSARAVVTGLGRYAANLVRHLAAVDRDNEYVILRRQGATEPLVLQGNFREVVIDHGMYSAPNLLGGARAIGGLDADIYHALFHFLPLCRCARRTIVTLHDLIWVLHPLQSTGRHWRRAARAVMAGPLIRHALTQADHIITTTEATRQALRHYGLAAAKVTAVHLGAAPPPAVAPADVLPVICKGRPFVFSLGNTLPCLTKTSRA